MAAGFEVSMDAKTSTLLDSDLLFDVVVDGNFTRRRAPCYVETACAIFVREAPCFCSELN